MPRPDYTLPLDQLPDPLPIEPLTKPFDVTITPPGSKSITCRAYVLAALAKGESKLIRPLRADDTDLLLKALCTLGADARWEGEDVFIKGVGGRFPRGGSVNLGDGGTPTRFMIACACLAAEPVTVDGSKRMRERPISEGVDMLRQLGAKIEYIEVEGRLPVRVTPSEKFVGGEIEVGQTQSSQFISAVLLIAPMLKMGITLRFRHEPTSISYIRLTLDVLNDWEVEERQNWWFPEGEPIGGFISVMPHDVVAFDFDIAPDASSAMYWLLGAAINPGSSATVPGLRWDMGQPDQLLTKSLDEMGPVVTRTTSLESATLCVRGTGRLIGHEIHASESPDGALAFVVCLSQAETASRITGLRTLRVKETDRIAALANELRKVGCEVSTGEDWIEITPPQGTPALRAGSGRELTSSGSKSRATTIIETYNDHRMAMAFAMLGLAAPGGRRLAIRNPACVAKSYPTFWKDFARLYQ